MFQRLNVSIGGTGFSALCPQDVIGPDQQRNEHQRLPQPKLFDNFHNFLKFSFGNSFRSSNHGVSFGVVFTSKYQNTKKIQGR